jgi:hypothetical protein
MNFWGGEGKKEFNMEVFWHYYRQVIGTNTPQKIEKFGICTGELKLILYIC